MEGGAFPYPTRKVFKSDKDFLNYFDIPIKLENKKFSLRKFSLVEENCTFRADYEGWLWDESDDAEILIYCKY